MESDGERQEKARYYRGLSLTARKAAGEAAEYYTRDPHRSITSLVQNFKNEHLGSKYSE